MQTFATRTQTRSKLFIIDRRHFVKAETFDKNNRSMAMSCCNGTAPVASRCVAKLIEPLRDTVPSNIGKPFSQL
jgi:hypothetical protein